MVSSFLQMTYEVWDSEGTLGELPLNDGMLLVL